jgi:UDP-2,3-diacylglucosamine pyrophosphatase LpxH
MAFKSTPMSQQSMTAYRQKIAAGLQRLYDEVLQKEVGQPPLRYDVNKDRYVIFSDQHRGGRDRADDFRHSEQAYNAALAYYYRMGYTLVVLGDAEELWKERPGTVVHHYSHSLGLENQFYQDGRYLRFWGNHDDEWRHADAVNKHLGRIFGQGLPVHEGLRIAVVDGDESLGHLFLAHGHQGTLESDRWGQFSRILVRYLYRPFQRLTGFSANTPATHWDLREGHNRAMYNWVANYEKLILIAGHTHRPVFQSLTHPAQIMQEIEEKRAEWEQDPLNEELRDALALLEAELEWVRAQQKAEPGDEGDLTPTSSRYFNTGCCSFIDGKITGIELFEGQMRLIRWPNGSRNPRRHQLAPAIDEEVLLRDILAT